MSHNNDTRGGLFGRGKANTSKEANVDRKLQPSRLGGCAGVWKPSHRKLYLLVSLKEVKLIGHWPNLSIGEEKDLCFN